MPIAIYTPPEPLDGRAIFLAMLKQADGTARAGVTVHVVLEGPGFLLPGSGYTGGHRFIFARTDDSGGLRFQWVGDPVDDPTPTSEGISLRASSTTGQALTIRQI